jgi:hypothetical protein
VVGSQHMMSRIWDVPQCHVMTLMCENILLL